MKNIHLFCIVVISLFSLASCQKEKKDGHIHFSLQVADNYNTSNNNKVYMDGYTPKFVEDEAIKINGETYIVDTRNGSPAVYDVAEASEYFAFYPASWVNGNASVSTNITFPDIQKYKIDATSGNQIVENPMVAHAEDGTTLKFHNVAALASVHILNNYGSALKVKYVAIYTDNTYLSGNGVITGFTGSTPNVNLTSGITNVSIDCSELPTLANDSTADVTFALPPINNVVLYVDVYLTSSDGATKYSFTKKTASGKTIGRSQIGDINITLNNGNNPDDVHECGLFWGTGVINETTDDPYLIMTKADLVQLQTQVAAGNSDYNASDVYYLQTANIDLGDETNWAGIGTSDHPFLANYDGSEASVTLNITSISGSTGIFGYVGGANNTFIKNLNVYGRITNDVEQAVGSICGTVLGDATVSFDKCTSYVSIKATYGSSSENHIMGGIIGEVTAGRVSISNCVNNGRIAKSYGCAGGIVGHVASTAQNCSITYCKNYPKINSLVNGYMGGICGYSEAPTTIQNCINEGEIAGVTAGTDCIYLGGIIGSATGCSIEKCTNKASVNGYRQVGGIAGCFNGTIIRNCHATSTVSINGNSILGGIVGLVNSNLTIDGCLNEAAIVSINTGGTYSCTGGVVGATFNNEIYLTIKNCGSKGSVRCSGASNNSSDGFIGGAYGNTSTINCFSRTTLYVASGGYTSGYISACNKSLVHTFRNCYAYNTYTVIGSGTIYYKSMYNRHQQNTVDQGFCYDNAGGGAWGSSTAWQIGAACKFNVTGSGPYTIKCAAKNANNTYWNSTDVTLLQALNNWCATPLDRDGSTAYGVSSDYLTWKADTDGFPTLNFDFIE